MAIESTESTERSASPMPIWMSIPIILICLLGGGWIIYLYVMTDPISHESKLLGDAPAQVQWQGGARNRANQPRRVVEDQGNGRWDLRTEKDHANLSVGKGKPVVHFIQYFNYPFVPADAIRTLMATRSLTADKTRVAALKLTADQARKLEQLSSRITMAASAADKELLINAVTAYNTADARTRPGLENGLLQLLDEIADRSQNATKQEAIDRVNRINSIVTPDMWKQNAVMGGR